MQIESQKALRKAVVAGLCVVVSMMLGCASDPGSPAPAPNAAERAFVPGAGPEAVPQGVGRASAKIGTRGGTVKLDDVEVVIPPGAFEASTRVTLTSASMSIVSINVSPATTLDQPATIRIRKLTERTDHLRHAQIALYKVQGVTWSRLPSVASDGAIEATSMTLGDFVLARGDTPEGEPLEPVRYLVGPGYCTQWISATEGGVMRYGAYVLRFPAGALVEDTYITIADAKNGYAMCDLSPHGIQFAVPVTLEFDLSKIDADGYTDLTIEWYDEGHDSWVDLGAAWEQDRVYVGLEHFSRYVLSGRAGW